jgi:hypothetical protein
VDNDYRYYHRFVLRALLQYTSVRTHRVGDRPDPYEPRLKKRRRNNYDWLTKPRAEMKRKMAKGVTEN